MLYILLTVQPLQRQLELSISRSALLHSFRLVAAALEAAAELKQDDEKHVAQVAVLDFFAVFYVLSEDLCCFILIVRDLARSTVRACFTVQSMKLSLVLLMALN